MKLGRIRVRSMVIVVASVLLVAVGAVAYGVRQGDDEPDTATGSGREEGYLVAGTLPEGWEPISAVEGDGHDPQLDISVFAGQVAVYGDASLEEAWQGPVLTVSDGLAGVAPDEVAGLSLEDVSEEGSEQTTVAGGQASVWSDDHDVRVVLFPDGGDSGDMIHLNGTGFVTAFGEEQARQAVLTAAEHFDQDQTIAAEGLPEGFESLAIGPVNAMLPWLGGYEPAEGLGLTFLRGNDTEGIHITQQPADDPRSAELLRGLTLDGEGIRAEATVEETEVRGQPAYRLRFEAGPDAPFEEDILQWYEPTWERLVTVTFAEADWPEVEQLIDGLRPAEPGEVDDLLQRYDPGEPD